MNDTVSDDPSSGIEVTFTPFIDDIGASDLRELAIAFVKADFVCSSREELVTDAEKAVPALDKLESIKFTSSP